MPLLSDRVTVTNISATHWSLTEPLAYRGRHQTFTVPAGFATDFATVPRVVVWLIARFGVYTLAAILHDWLCEVAVPSGLVSANDADGLFRRVLREQGVSGPRRWLMWAGVRWGSLLGGRHRGWWRTAPAVLGVSVLAAPVVVLGGAPVVTALALWWLMEMVAWLFAGARGAPPRLHLRT